MKEKRTRRVLVDAAVLFALYFVGLWAMAHFRVMEVLLSPGGDSHAIRCMGAVAFLMLRTFVIVLAPGWILARLAAGAWREHARLPAA